MFMSKINDLYNQKFIGRYGSRRGFIRACWHRLLYTLGVYNNYSRINWDKIDRLVFICKGNICRSAYAEAVSKSLGIDTISCGISTVIDAPANADAIEIASKRGVNLKQHKTTPIASAVLRKTDLLVVMEPWQADSLNRILKTRHYITLQGIWLAPLRPHLHDPYGHSSAYFNNCFEYIEKSVNEITKKIQRT